MNTWIMLTWAEKDAEGVWQGRAMTWLRKGEQADIDKAIDFARREGYDVRRYWPDDEQAEAKAKADAAAAARDREKPLCVVCATPLTNSRYNACGKCWGTRLVGGGGPVGVRPAAPAEESPESA